jgi:predicted transcriptional regulator
MAGHKGNIKVTIKGLKIVNINPELNQLMISGPIPGARNSEVFLNLEGIEAMEEPVVEEVAAVESPEVKEEAKVEEAKEEASETEEK